MQGEWRVEKPGHTDPKAVRLSVQFYRLTLLLYPAEFRRQYGEPMLQVFRDSGLAASRQGHLARLWGHTLADIFLSVIEQYANRGAVMTKTTWIRLSGWLMAASSLFILIGWFAGSRPEYSEYNAFSLPIDRFLSAVAFPSMLIGVVLVGLGMLGLLARFDELAGALGRAGLVLGLLGVAVTLVGVVGLNSTDSSPWWELSMFGTAAIFIGIALFGVDCIRRQLFPRWNSLPLLIGLPWPLLILFDILSNSITGVNVETPQLIISAVILISFLGLGVVGYLLQTSTFSQRAAYG